MYKLIVDLGKPYEMAINTDKELEKELNRIKQMAQTQDYPYVDIVVYNEKDEDITETQFIQEMINGDD